MIFLALPMMCCFGGPFVLQLAGSRTRDQLELNKAEAKRLEMPLELGDLDLPVVPPEKNAAVVYREIEKLLSGKFKEQQAIVNAGTRFYASAQERAFAEGALSELRPVLELTKELESRPLCNFERDWSKPLSLRLPEPSSMRSFAIDLCLQADLQDKKGDWRGALRTLELASRVAVDCGSDPILLGMYVRIGAHLAVDREYERLLIRHDRDRQFIDAAEAAIRSNSAPPDILNYLRGEVVFQRLGLLSSTSSQDLTGGRGKPDEFEKGLFRMKFVKDVLDQKYIQAWRVGWALFPRDTSDWDGYRKALKTMAETVDKDRSVENRVNRIIFAAYWFGMDSFGTMQARDRMLLTSIAILRDRLRTGRPSASLPASLGTTALDPFDGKPLRYRVQGNGFIIYSIARDRTDDGGHRRTPRDARGIHYDEVIEFK